MLDIREIPRVVNEILIFITFNIQVFYSFREKEIEGFVYSLEIMLSPSNRVTRFEEICFSEKQGFTVFQNFMLYVIRLVSRLL